MMLTVLTILFTCHFAFVIVRDGKQVKGKIQWLIRWKVIAPYQRRRGYYTQNGYTWIKREVPIVRID